MAFNPQEHLTKLQGRDYLEVKWRIVWFKDSQPNGAINTDVISFDPLVVKATILIDGVIVATGHGSANAGDRKVVWSGKELEKAETAAIGRALAHAGYGTQFTDDVEDGPADSPVERKSNKPAPVERRAVQPAPANVSKLAEHFDAPDEPAQPNPFPITIEKVKVHVPASGKQYIELLPGGVISWTRQPFRDLGIECENWTEANSVYTLPEKVSAHFVVDGTLKKLVRLEKVAA